MLSIIPEVCEFLPDRSRGVIVIESDIGGPPFNAAFDELKGTDAITMAQGYASSNGLGVAYLNGNVEGPYPVNSEGLSLEHVRDGQGKSLPAQHPRMQPARYRVSVPVSRPIR